MTRNKLIAITGTTASGKSGLGIELAKLFDGVVISADSRQIYKGLDLGTGKVTQEEMQGIPHELLDVRAPGEQYSLAEFLPEAYAAIDKTIQNGKLPILVGGTGLYTRAVIEGYSLAEAKPDEELRAELAQKSRDELVEEIKKLYPDAETDGKDARRLVRLYERLRTGEQAERKSEPRYDVLQIGLTCDRDALYARIGERLDARIRDGMVEEIKGLMDAGVSYEFLDKLGLEYRFTAQYLTGQFADFAEYREKLFQAIRHFAKRQMTWFRKEKQITWLDCLDPDCLEKARAMVAEFLGEQA